MLGLLYYWKNKPTNQQYKRRWRKIIKTSLVFPAPSAHRKLLGRMLLNIFYTWTHVITDTVQVPFLQTWGSAVHPVQQLALFTYQSGLTASWISPEEWPHAVSAATPSAAGCTQCHNEGRWEGEVPGSPHLRQSHKENPCFCGLFESCVCSSSFCCESALLCDSKAQMCVFFFPPLEA